MADWKNEFQEWLSESDALHNAQLGANRLIKKKWNKKSICAVLGNMRVESSVNPNMYEYGYDWGNDRGFGLVQWTPRSKYWNWALQNGYKESELRDGEAQMDRIDYEAKNGIQWASTPNYPESFASYRKNANDKSIEYLTEAFTWNYERPLQEAGEESMPERVAFAKKCYDELDFGGNNDGGDDGEDNEDDDSDGNFGDIDWGDLFPNDPLGAVKKVIDGVLTKLEEFTNFDMHSIGNDKHFTNKYFYMVKTYNNTYRVKFNVDVFNELKDLVNPPDDDSGNDNGGSDGGNDGDDNDGNKSKYNTCDIKSHELWFRYAKTADDFPPGYPYPEANGHHGNDYGFVNEVLKSPVSGTVDGNDGHGITNNDGGIGYDGDGMGWGNRIVIKLDDGSGRSLLFAHLGKISVKSGDKIKVGQRIGVTGNTGEMTTGPHLHLELKDTKNSDAADDGTIDPTPFIDKHCNK